MVATYVTLLYVLSIALLVILGVRDEAEEHDEHGLGEATDEDDEDRSEPGQVLGHHPVDHGDHGTDQLYSSAEEEEVEAVTEHTHGGENVLEVGETEKPCRNHEDDSDAAEQEHDPDGGKYIMMRGVGGSTLMDTSSCCPGKFFCPKMNIHGQL